MRLAQALEHGGRKAVVINADSQQVYADLRILSARPNEDEMGGIEHRLFGTWDGARACTAADWAEAAKREIARCHAEDAVPILVGGTGLYLRTLLDGIAPIPAIEPEVRDGVRNLSTHELREELYVADPVAATQLSRNDVQRMSRALEVKLSTGRTLGEWQLEKVGGIASDFDLHAAIVLPDREWLYRRCDLRVDQMLASGAVTEVAALLERKLDPTLPVMRAIGVREISQLIPLHLHSHLPVSEMKTATRQYAKRQYTWFRHQPPSEWTRLGCESHDETEIFARLLRK